MAQGRFLSKTIATSRQLAALSDRAEVLFYRMIPHQDVEGRIEGDPELVKAQVIPLKKGYTVEVITDLLHELAETVDGEGKPLLHWYRVKGRAVIQFPGFKDHQSGLRPGRETPSRLPEMGTDSEPITRTPATVRPRRGIVAGVMSAEVRNGAGATPAEVKVSEVQGKSKVSIAAHAADEPPLGNWPAEFTALYSRHLGEVEIGRVGKRCKPVVRKYGLERATEMWDAYCRFGPHRRYGGEIDPEYDNPEQCSPERFAASAKWWFNYTEPMKVPS